MDSPSKVVGRRSPPRLSAPRLSGVVDQDLPHGPGGEGQEVGPVLDRDRALHELDEGLVDE